MEKIPCVNCITLSACRATISNDRVDNVNKLTKKCSILHEYIHGKYDTNFERICDLIKFYQIGFTYGIKD